MPMYSYTCVVCNHEFEQINKISDRDNCSCEQCGSNETQRGVGYSGHFNISGFCAANNYTGILGHDKDFIKQYGKQTDKD